MLKAMVCTFCDKGRPAAVKGMCRPCYTRTRRARNPKLTDQELLDCQADWAARFWSNVDDNQYWTGTLSKQGYGAFGIGDYSYSAHRLSYLLAHGVPQKRVIMHTCDERDCVNPAHLVNGSYRDNVQDMIAKGRQGDSGKGRKRPQVSGDNHWRKKYD